MSKRVGFLILTLFPLAFLRAESVWTGNAGVGSLQQFPGSREYFRAASNSFPIGTILEVMNPRERASVEVTVVERLEFPGVFLLIEMSAAKIIGIPLDYIRPVQVTPIGSSDIGNYTPARSSEPDDGENADTADIPPNTQESIYPMDADDGADSPRDRGPETVAAASPPGIEMIDEIGAFEDTGEEILGPFDTYDKTENKSLIPDQETPDVEKASGDTPDEVEELASAGESGSDMRNSERGENQLLFLTPSDFRPPTGGTAATPIEETFSTIREEDFAIPEYKTGDAGKYIQIGAYRSREIFETRVNDIQQSNPDYPLRVAIASENSAQTVYKLLVGPVKPAEIGVVLDTVRRSKFSDAFQFVR